jgi:predicted ribosomally synthesized peptide with SipW-like signal peptide
MKKKLTVIFLCVALAAIAIVGASLAYFTDTKSATNTFTVGNVKINLIESRYHRAGNDNAGDTSVPDPTTKAAGMEFVPDGWTVFTDDEIQADAEKYSEYIGERGKNMVPGRNVVKCPYVVNTGANDAYIRIRVMIPSAANNDFVRNVKDGGVITNQWCSTAFINGEFIDGKGGGWNNAPAIERNVEKDGMKYDVYTFTRTEPLAAGKMTEWNVWNYIGIDKTATSADIQKAIDAGAIKVTETDGGAKTMTLNVLVEADAIQSEGFADAAAAWAAFK